MKRFIILLSVLSVAMGLMPRGPFAVAQDAKPTGLSISPTFQEIEIRPEQTTKNVSFLVTNYLDETQHLRLQVLDFGSLDETGGLILLGSEAGEIDKKYGLAKWLRLEKDQVRIKPNQTLKVRATVLNDEEMSPGGHYGALLVRLDSTLNRSNVNRVGINQVLSSLVFARKIGGEKLELQVKQLDNHASLLATSKTIDLWFQNAGNTHLTPRGLVTITGPRGKLVSEGTINTESGIILPEKSRKLTVAMAPLSRAWLPGRYTVTVQYRYDGMDEFRTATYRFWYLGPVALAVVLLLALFLILVRYRRHLPTALISFTANIKKVIHKPRS